MMEAVIVQEFLEHESYGWIGWLSLLLLGVTIVLSFLSKSVMSIISNIRTIQNTLKSPKADYKKQVKHEVDISNIIRTIRHDLKADRVLVLQYHNGVHSIAHNHLLKISATHEAIDRNTKSMMNFIQAWPSNYLQEWNVSLFENRFIEVKDKVDIVDAPGLRGVCEFLNAFNVDRMILFPITDPYGEVFGVGMVHLSEKANYPSRDMVKWASQRFYAVGALLAGVQE